jgi:hypothetical protein
MARKTEGQEYTKGGRRGDFVPYGAWLILGQVLQNFRLQIPEKRGVFLPADNRLLCGRLIPIPQLLGTFTILLAQGLEPLIFLEELPDGSLVAGKPFNHGE